MHVGLLALAVVPLVALLVVVVLAGQHIVGALRQGRAPAARHVAGAFLALAALAAGASLAIVVDAGLSHSEAAKARASWLSAGVFLVVVVLPAIVLAAATHRARSRVIRLPPSAAGQD